MKSFNATFAVSFKKYCEMNNIEEPPTDMIDKWKKDVIESYSKTAPTKFVMQLFNIPKEHKSLIDYHSYEIYDTGHLINTEEKILFVYMKLKIKR